MLTMNGFEKFGRIAATVGCIFGAILWFLLAWVGSAQLAVAVFGRENNIIILIAVGGMGIGLWGGLMILTMIGACWPEKDNDV